MATKRKFNVGDIVMLKSTGEVFEIKRYVSPHYVVDDGRCYTAVQLEKAGDENFKYGDRVRVIEDTGTLEVGEVGSIIAKDNDGTYLFESDTDSAGKHRGHEDGLVWGRGGKFGEHRCGWVFPYEVEKIVEEVKQEETKVKETPKKKEVKKDKFKVGDRVVCKTDTAYGFRKGGTGTVIAKMTGADEYYLIRHDIPNQLCHDGAFTTYEWGKPSHKDDCTNERAEKFELIEPSEKKEEIHITRKGSEVHAILKKDGKLVKRTVAKCHPDDEFDFEKGAKLAMNRLYGADVFKEKEPYNGYVMCLSNNGGGNNALYTEGKVYKFENGYITCDDGKVLSAKGTPVMSFEEWNEFSYSDFKEIKVKRCDEYKVGDRVLVKSEKQVDDEDLMNSDHARFVRPMRKYCNTVITLERKDVSDGTFHSNDWWWEKDFFVGKVVE